MYKEHSQQWCYIGISVFFSSSNTKKHAPAMELNLFFLAPLLQCTSIDRCALFMRAKKNLFYWFPVIKILFHSLSHSVPLSLSVTPSEALILSQNSLKLSSSLSHSPLSLSLSQAPLVTATGSTQPSQAALKTHNHSPLSSSLIHRRWLDPAVLSCRSP